jgi:hypothetical protein
MSDYIVEALAKEEGAVDDISECRWCCSCDEFFEVGLKLGGHHEMRSSIAYAWGKLGQFVLEGFN